MAFGLRIHFFYLVYTYLASLLLCLQHPGGEGIVENHRSELLICYDRLILPQICFMFGSALHCGVEAAK